jgi:DNA-binding response OmpR family regulator
MLQPPRNAIMLAVRRKCPRLDVLRAVRDALAAGGQAVRVSEHLKDLFPAPSLVVLLDGWGRMQLPEAAANLRSLLPWTPTLAILTAPPRRALPPDISLRDCIAWPVAREELLAQVQVALRDAQPIKTATITVDPARLVVRCNDVHMTLTRGEFRLMTELLKSQDHWSSSSRLLESMAGERRLGMTPVAERIHAIRTKLQYEAWRLHSHRALGYFFDASQGRYP